MKKKDDIYQKESVWPWILMFIALVMALYVNGYKNKVISELNGRLDYFESCNVMVWEMDKSAANQLKNSGVIRITVVK